MQIRRLCVVLFLAILVASGCVWQAVTREAAIREPFAVAHRAGEADLIRGLAASGQVGDYALENELIRVVISDIPHASGAGKSGGNIIDACDRRTSVDGLNEVLTYFDDTFPRQAVYDQIAVLNPGGADQSAEIGVSGHDSMESGIGVSTTYSLEPGVRFVRIRTTLVNRTRSLLKQFDLGDAIQWGLTEHFAPGIGHELAGRRPKLEWLGSTGSDASYGMSVKTGRMATRHGKSWSDVIVGAPDIEIGQSASYERYFVVGAGGTSEVSSAALALRGVAASSLKGRIVEHRHKSPVAGATIEITNATRAPVGAAKTDANGWYSADLSPGRYHLVVKGMHRAPSPPFQIDILPGQQCVYSGEVGTPGRIKLLAVDEKGQPVPAKFTFEGVGNTADPFFGPKYLVAGALNVVFAHTGEAETSIAPGTYRVTVSRGIEYTIHQQVAFVEAGKTAEVRARIHRVVRTPGYLAADLHQHAAPSFDSATPLEDRVISNVCEGVEIVAMTDHDVHTDLAPVIERLGLTSHIKSLVGDEVTTDQIGHFNGFPLPHLPSAPGNGAVAHKGKTAREIFASLRRLNPRTVIQVNHPRAGKLGYFNCLGLEADTGTSQNAGFCLDFDAIEVLNGKYVSAAQRVLRDWFNLLNLGHRFTALGSSDSHAPVTQEAGCPRTLLFLGIDSPDRVTGRMVAAAIKVHRRAIVTNGPVVWMAVNDRVPIGATVSDTDGMITIDLSVTCAPWVMPNRLELICNGQTVKEFALPLTPDVVRLREQVKHPVRSDSWFVAVAWGEQSLHPVMPASGSRTVTPFGCTNPIWVDADGDGKFTSARK